MPIYPLSKTVHGRLETIEAIQFDLIQFDRKQGNFV